MGFVKCELQEGKGKGAQPIPEVSHNLTVADVSSLSFLPINALTNFSCSALRRNECTFQKGSLMHSEQYQPARCRPQGSTRCDNRGQRRSTPERSLGHACLFMSASGSSKFSAIPPEESTDSLKKRLNKISQKGPQLLAWCLQPSTLTPIPTAEHPSAAHAAAAAEAWELIEKKKKKKERKGTPWPLIMPCTKFLPGSSPREDFQRHFQRDFNDLKLIPLFKAYSDFNPSVSISLSTIEDTIYPSWIQFGVTRTAAFCNTCDWVFRVDKNSLIPRCLPLFHSIDPPAWELPRLKFEIQRCPYLARTGDFAITKEAMALCETIINIKGELPALYLVLGASRGKLFLRDRSIGVVEIFHRSNGSQNDGSLIVFTGLDCHWWDWCSKWWLISGEERFYTYEDTTSLPQDCEKSFLRRPDPPENICVPAWIVSGSHNKSRPCCPGGPGPCTCQQLLGSRAPCQLYQRCTLSSGPGNAPGSFQKSPVPLPCLLSSGDAAEELLLGASGRQTLGLLAFGGTIPTHQRAGHSRDAGQSQCKVDGHPLTLRPPAQGRMNRDSALLAAMLWRLCTDLIQEEIPVQVLRSAQDAVQYLKLHSIDIIRKEINKESVYMRFHKNICIGRKREKKRMTYNVVANCHSQLSSTYCNLVVHHWKVFQRPLFIHIFINIITEGLQRKLELVEGHMSTTTTIIDGKNGSVPSSSMRVGKKSVTEDFVNTFSSPAAWLLVVALIVTWSAVAIVMFDLVDYKDLAEMTISMAELQQRLCHTGVSAAQSRSRLTCQWKGVGRSVHKLSTEPLRIIHETLEESSDWIYGFFSLLSDIVWSDDDDSDEGEVEPSLKKGDWRSPFHPGSQDLALFIRDFVTSFTELQKYNICGLKPRVPCKCRCRVLHVSPQRPTPLSPSELFLSLCRLLLKLYKHQGAQFLGSKAEQKLSESSVVWCSEQLFCLGSVKFTPSTEGHERRRQSPGRWAEGSGITGLSCEFGKELTKHKFGNKDVQIENIPAQLLLCQGEDAAKGAHAHDPQKLLSSPCQTPEIKSIGSKKIQKQKTERPEKRTPAKATQRDKPEKQEKTERKEPPKVTSKDKLERQEKPEKKERHAAVHKEKPEKPEKQEKKAPPKVTQKDAPERHEKTEKKTPPKEEKKVKSTKVEAKVKKEVKDGKGEAKMAEKVKQAETKTTETGLIKAKTKVKEEKALQTVTKSDKKDQYAFCRYVIDMFAQGDFYPEYHDFAFSQDRSSFVRSLYPNPSPGGKNLNACEEKSVVVPREVKKRKEEKKKSDEKKTMTETKVKEHLFSLSLVPDSLSMPPFLHRECLVNGPPARHESSGRKCARVWSSSGTWVQGGPRSRRSCPLATKDDSLDLATACEDEHINNFMLQLCHKINLNCDSLYISLAVADLTMWPPLKHASSSHLLASLTQGNMRHITVSKLGCLTFHPEEHLLPLLYACLCSCLTRSPRAASTSSLVFLQPDHVLMIKKKLLYPKNSKSQQKLLQPTQPSKKQQHQCIVPPAVQAEMV
ncbi:hypothetical protein EK904_009863 [Melospiza melodia maxima]|nr:hypothetical protein EK904_009863 [Melospiza melodia maxima]